MRRFFRFSIRDLFWLTVVVAVALGWLVRERQLQHDWIVREQQLQAEADNARKDADGWKSRCEYALSKIR